MQVGLFFGSFNPIHIGHLNIAQLSLEKGNLDEVWFIVSPQNPFKEKKHLAKAAIRLEMIQLAIEGQTGLKASDVEFSLPQPSYTIDTLDLLKSKHPNHNFQILLGTDNLANLHDWKSADRLIAENKFVVYPRIGHQKHDYDQMDNFTFLDLPIIEISSTDIRKRISQGRSHRFMITDKVYQFLKSKDLYKL